MTTSLLLIYVITGAFGAGYMVYGKNQSMIVPTISGLALCIYPYFTQNLYISIIIGLFLIIIPFVIKV